MKTKPIVAGGRGAGVLPRPAFGDFWTVREGRRAECKIVATKPTDTKITIVGDTVYKTHEEATKEMTTACK